MKARNKIVVALCLWTSAFAGMAQRIAHPSLLFTPQRVEEARREAKADSAYARAWREIQKKADEQLEKNNVAGMEYLALGFQMTDDKRYAEKLRTLLLDVAKTDSWSDSEMIVRKPAWRSELQMAHKSYQLALAYDAVYDYLSAGDRKTIAQGVYRLAVVPALGDWLLEPTRIHTLNSMGHNWWSSCVGMGGLLALAISNEVPEAREGARRVMEVLPEWFDFAGDAMLHKPRTFDRDGGMYESINYASFGISEALLMRLAWKNTHPGEALEDIPQIGQLADFFCQASYPRTGEMYSISFGDSHKNVVGDRVLLLSYALGEKSPNALWYLSHLVSGQHREGFPINSPMGLLYLPDLLKSPELPSLPTQMLWNDFGWATMRDTWQPDGTMLAVKSGLTWNHSHADANSFVLFHKGVDIIKDAGNCSYGRPEYRNYFFQSEAHNVVLFNGKGQSTYQQYHGTMCPGSLHSLQANDRMHYVLADGTGPMSDSFARNYRQFLWIDNVILVIDDIKAHTNGSFEWVWHPGGTAKKKGYDLEVTEGNSSVVIRPLFPQYLAPSGYVHDYPEMLYWEVRKGPTEDLKGEEEYYSFKLPGQYDRMKAVTSIILKDSPDQKELPVIERRSGENWLGLTITYQGKKTDVYINELADGRVMHYNSWVEADGWTTDAYMWVVSGDDMFIDYGSSLRKGDEVYFSSLSKMNVMTLYSKDALDVQLDGQPRVNCYLRPQQHVRQLKVNGQSFPLNKEGELLHIKYKKAEK
jgi:hypothetical protein